MSIDWDDIGGESEVFGPDWANDYEEQKEDPRVEEYNIDSWLYVS